VEVCFPVNRDGFINRILSMPLQHGICFLHHPLPAVYCIVSYERTYHALAWNIAGLPISDNHTEWVRYHLEPGGILAAYDDIHSSYLCHSLFLVKACQYLWPLQANESLTMVHIYLPYHSFLAPHFLILEDTVTLSSGLHTTPSPGMHAGVGNHRQHDGLNHSMNV